MVPIGKDGTRIEWMQCNNPGCIILGNKQRVVEEGYEEWPVDVIATAMDKLESVMDIHGAIAKMGRGGVLVNVLADAARVVRALKDNIGSHAFGAYSREMIGAACLFIALERAGIPVTSKQVFASIPEASRRCTSKAFNQLVSTIKGILDGRTRGSSNPLTIMEWLDWLGGLVSASDDVVRASKKLVEISLVKKAMDGTPQKVIAGSALYVAGIACLAGITQDNVASTGNISMRQLQASIKKMQALVKGVDVSSIISR